MARKAQPISFRIFIGDRPFEEFTPEELDAWRERALNRMSEGCCRYTAQHPEALETLKGKDYVQWFDADGNEVFFDRGGNRIWQDT